MLGLTGYYMTAPGYFVGNVDYTGFFLHHCVHYMDLVSFLVSPVTKLTARKVEKEPGKVLFHVNFDFECGAIGTIAMGTIQSRGAPVERIELMGDHQRIEVENVIDVRWNRNPPFKMDDPRATLSDADDSLTWKPNFTAAANEDPKGYHSLLADVIPALEGRETLAPHHRRWCYRDGTAGDIAQRAKTLTNMYPERNHPHHLSTHAVIQGNVSRVNS